jgi:hypothetical protein
LREGEVTIVSERDALGGRNRHMVIRNKNGRTEQLPPLGSKPGKHKSFEVFEVPAGNRTLRLPSLHDIPLDTDADGNLFLQVRVDRNSYIKLLAERVYTRGSNQGGDGSLSDTREGASRGLDGFNEDGELVDPTVDGGHAIYHEDNQPAGVDVPLAAAKKNTNYTVANEDLVFADAGSGAVTITMPKAATLTRRITVVKVDASANKVSVAAASGDTINTAASIDLTTQGDQVTAVSDGNTSLWAS